MLLGANSKQLPSDWLFGSGMHLKDTIQRGGGVKTFKEILYVRLDSCFRNSENSFDHSLALRGTN